MWCWLRNEMYQSQCGAAPFGRRPWWRVGPRSPPYFSAWKCNPPKCKVHDFLKIFQAQHGLHFSWEHSWLMYFKWICNLNWSNKMQLATPGSERSASVRVFLPARTAVSPSSWHHWDVFVVCWRMDDTQPTHASTPGCPALTTSLYWPRGMREVDS